MIALPNPWPELPGTIDVTIERGAVGWGEVALVARHRCGAYSTAAVQRVPWHLVDDTDKAGASRLAGLLLDRFIRPWAHPDRPTIGPIVVFPRLARLERTLRRLARR